ncbi:FtsX-like permease family protein [Roseivirga sp.]|uniref:ABC transporter permease n=1 Tax=Roseivirga sp. TaxID=1964215 RepID=UPI003B8D52A9
MFKNHFRQTLRRLKREKLYTIVNIFGLTVGLTAFLLISLYVRDELSYDSFHTDGDQIYLLTDYDDVRGSESTQAPVDFVEYVKRGVPEVESFTRMKDPSWKSTDLIQSDGSDFYSERIFHVDENFFDFFDFEVIDGNRSTVLSKIGNVVLTESFAMKLFNHLDIIGEELILNKKAKYYISGICKDAPGNSSLQFDLIARAPEDVFKDKFSEKHYLDGATSFVKLSKQAKVKAVLTPINNEIRRIPAYFKVRENTKYQLHGLEDIHTKAGLSSNEFETADFQSVLVFSTIALIILFLAIINYVNLVTAQSMNRVKEIGLRKVIGAGRVHLLKYQLLESILISMISLGLSFGITERLMPLFNSYLKKDIALNYFSLDFLFWVIIIGVILGLVAGVYPAFYITRVRPLSLMNKSAEAGNGKGYLRKGLVLFQFIVSGVIILILLIMSQQMSFLDQQNMGFEKDNLITIPLYAGDKSDFGKLKSEVLRLPGVQSASINTWRFGGMTSSGYTDRAPVKGEEFIESWSDIVQADEDFIKTMSLKLVATSAKFKNGRLSDHQVIISESVAEKFGWGDDALEKNVFKYGRESKEVVAIAADFHSYSFKDQIKPMVIEKEDMNRSSRLIIKIDRIEEKRILAALDEVYTALTDRPLAYYYLNDQVEDYYASEVNQYRLFQIFSALAVSISFLGLMAITIYMAAQRRKEVSIRKVLGASVRNLILMLNKEFTILVVISFLIATPITYYVMQGWLASFSYRTALSPLLFIGAFVLFLSVSWMITFGQFLTVTRENPAKVLREE